MLIYRIVSPDDAAKGRFDVGRLVMVASETEVLAVVKPGEVLVRQVPQREVTRMRLDDAMNKRVIRDEDARFERQQKARTRFIAALTGEPEDDKPS